MKTLLSEHFSETEEKKSQFLSFLVPYNQFEARLAELRDLHPKASHHVTAFRRFDEDKRLHEGSKDDGEPSGCAGVPILKVLQGNDLVNVGLIVVRYFGGTKLGTGGMARAYGMAAKTAVETAPLIDFAHQSTATFEASFERTSDLERLLTNTNITDRQYSETGINIVISDDEDTVEKLKEEWERVNY
jgi:uncharacterized YigZ family protein